MARAVVVVVLAWLLSACGVSLRTHAQAARISAELIDQAGAAIEREARARWDGAAECTASACVAIGVDARRERVRLAFAPIEIAYESARRAHASYMHAIASAIETGESVDDVLPRKLLETWRELVAIARATVGIPAPTPALEALASEVD